MVQGADAQKMRDVFVAMPDSVLPYLSKVNKEDFIDFMDSKMKAVVKNTFGEQSEMTALTADYAKVNLSGRSSLELKLLPLADSTRVICMIRTVGDSLKTSSSIFFYAADWSKRLKRSDYLKLPEMAEYMIQRPDSISAEDYTRKEQKIDVFLQNATFVDNGNLCFTLSTGEMNEDDRKEVTPYIKGKIEYVWNKKDFARNN